jgi:hypothetical protein
MSGRDARGPNEHEKTRHFGEFTFAFSGARPAMTYFAGSLTKATLLRPAFEASARVSAT